MIGPSFMDNMETDICGDFFDHIDDLLDFPSTDDMDLGGVGFGGDNCFNGFQDLVWSPPPLDTLLGPTPTTTSIFAGSNSTTGGTSDLSTELSVPDEDIAQLEWLSNFVEDSFSAGSIILDKEENSQNNNDSHQFQTSSPVSVLESSSSCSVGKTTMPLSPDTFVPGRARSKRPRPQSFNPRPPLIQYISPTSSVTESTPTPYSAIELQSEFENFAESSHSHPSKKIMKKKKKKKLSPPTEQSASPPQPIAIRKCMHCEITKTPQWRAGPKGPKTLCNACGVRYKSGRLFPEYRPAASPTFVAALHSNSHKKVVEMRTKACHKTGMAATATATAIIPTPEFLPKSSHLLDDFI